MKRPVSFWIMIAVAAVVVIFLGIKIFGNNQASVTPTAVPSPTRVAPTPLPSATNIPPTAVPTAVPTATNVPPTAIPTVNPVQNIIWQWLTVTQHSTGVQTNTSNPAAYTINFYPDGTLSGLADCNTFGGTYSQKNGFTIKITNSTATFCGDSSLDQQYLQLLSNVTAGGPDGIGGLALETAGAAERMLFTNGGAAVQP